MGIADEHYAALSLSGELYVDDDGYPTVPPFEGAGGMDLWFSQATERGFDIPPPPPPKRFMPDFARLNIFRLLEALEQNRIRPCPCCGSAAKGIEYPLGIACSRWSCAAPGKLPIYISDKDAVSAGFDSVIECWNAAVLTPERDALVWPSLQPGFTATPATTTGH